MILQEILVHIAQEGVTSQGIFRRPGSSIDQKIIVKKLMEGKQVQYADYNHYTLTGVIKVCYLKCTDVVYFNYPISHYLKYARIKTVFEPQK